MRHHARRFAAAGLGTVGVAGVRDDVERIGIERLLRGLGHRLQTAVVACIQHHTVRRDEGVFRVDRSLHILRRVMGPGHRHEARFRLRVLLQFLERSLHGGRRGKYQE